MKPFAITAWMILAPAVMPLSAASTPEPLPSSAQAVFVVDTQLPAKPYHRMIFGGFIEHFDNQVYGGVFEPGSPLANRQGFRRDVIAALKELKIQVIRWPGGCFVDSYHWQKGAGKNRQPQGDFRWGVIEPNTFGTHEFVELCRLIGAEPYICHNGLADPQENLDWVAYCNATEGKFAEMRKANGHAKPLNVRFWSVGNERYDNDYVNRVRDTVDAMKALDADLRVTCAGSQGDGSKQIAGVSSYLMEQAGKNLDYVSVHNYYLPRADQLPDFDYLSAIMKSEAPDANMTIVTESLCKAGQQRIKIAFDEWNLRAWQHPGFPRDKVENYEAPEVRELVARRRKQNDEPSQYTMADALFSASFLNACLRHSEQVTMATVAPLVNTRGPLFVHPKGLVKRTHFHTMEMYANLLEARVAAGQVTAENLTQGSESVAVVDAIATSDDSGRKWALALVNRHPFNAVACSVTLGKVPLEGRFRAAQLAGDSPDAYNDIDHPDRVAPKNVMLTFEKGLANLPPHSLTIVRLSGRRAF